MNPEDQRTSCPGFLDEFGVWNNGFECPPLAGQVRICCESEARRYCCTLDNLRKSLLSSSPSPLSNLLNSYSTIETSLFFTERKPSTILSLPILLISFLSLIIIFLLIFLCLCFWFRYRKQNRQRKQEENSPTKTTLLIDHFPFTPPHHQLFLHNNTSPFHHHQQTRDTLTTTTMAPSSTASSSSTSGRIPSDIYFHDWKDFLTTADQPMNIYPTMSSHSIELNHDHHYHGKRQYNDVVV